MTEEEKREIEETEALLEECYQAVIDYQNHVDNLDEVRSVLFSDYDESEYEIGWEAGYWILGNPIETIPTTETEDYIDIDSNLGQMLLKHKEYFDSFCHFDKDLIWYTVNITGYYYVSKKAAC